MFSVMKRLNISIGKVLVLFDFPTDEEAEAGEAIISDQHRIVDNIFKKSGLDPDKNVYYTYIFKIKPNKVSNISSLYNIFFLMFIFYVLCNATT
jgi:hypothetical protein